MKISTKNIDNLIRKVKKSLNTKTKPKKGGFLIINFYKKVLTNRYTGSGRPKISDYDSVLDKDLIDDFEKIGFDVSNVKKNK